MFNKLTQLLAVFIFLADPVRPDLTNNKVTAVLNVTTQSGTNLKSVVLIDSSLAFYRILKLRPIDNALLVNILTSSNKNNTLKTFDQSGCTQYLNENLPVNFVAIVDDSGCEIEHKIVLAIQNNASALIVIVSAQNYSTSKKEYKGNGIATLVVHLNIGQILRMAASHLSATISIRPGITVETISKPSMHIISVVFFYMSFAVLVFLSLILILVIAIQKYRLYKLKKQMNVYILILFFNIQFLRVNIYSFMLVFIF